MRCDTRSPLLRKKSFRPYHAFQMLNGLSCNRDFGLGLRWLTPAKRGHLLARNVEGLKDLPPPGSNGPVRGERLRDL